MKTLKKRIGIVLLVITFPIWFLPVVIVSGALSLLDDVFDISWDK